METPKEHNLGMIYALTAFIIWGLIPIYFKAVSHVSIWEVQAHRFAWSLPITALLITISGKWGELKKGLTSGKVWLSLLASTGLIAANGLIYVYSIFTGQMLESSLGYYLNPLLNVVLGMVFLGERLTRRQTWAVALAAAGTLNLTIAMGRLPWIALSLALCFGFYGLVRKKVALGPVTGLFMECCLIAPVALGFLAWLYLGFSDTPQTLDLENFGLLALAGPLTVTPLICFTAGARRLDYSTVGLLQYLAPSLQFLLAVWLFGEVFTVFHFITFALIWSGLALYVSDTLKHRAKYESAP